MALNIQIYKKNNISHRIDTEIFMNHDRDTGEDSFSYLTFKWNYNLRYIIKTAMAVSFSERIGDFPLGGSLEFGVNGGLFVENSRHISQMPFIFFFSSYNFFEDQLYIPFEKEFCIGAGLRFDIKM